jgi:hypothetical protein
MLLTLLSPQGPPPTPSTKIWLKVGGVWKQTTVYIRIGGSWKISNPAIKVTGTWRT